MAHFEVSGRDVWCGTGGLSWQADRPLAVLIHGAGHDHSVWALQARTLGQHGWNIAAPDLPGHGQSQDDPSLETIGAYSEWLGAFLDAVGADNQTAMVGHSMGACIAVEFAGRHPDAVTTMVLVGAGERLPVNRGLLDDTLNAPSRAHRFIAAFGHGRGSHFGGAQNPGVWNLGAALALLERCAPEVLHRDFHACNQWEGGAVATKIVCPSLVLAGAQDRMTPVAAGKALVGKIPSGTLEVLPDAGHMMMAEVPKEVNRALFRFLGRE